MAEDARGGMRAGGNFFEVGAAHATGMHADEHFARADGGDGNGFEADIVDPAVDCGLHGRGDRVQGSFDGELSGKELRAKSTSLRSAKAELEAEVDALA